MDYSGDQIRARAHRARRLVAWGGVDGGDRGEARRQRFCNQRRISKARARTLLAEKEKLTPALQLVFRMRVSGWGER